MRGKDIGSEIDRNFPSKMFPSKKKKVFVIFKAPAVSIIARTISSDASLITEKLVKNFFADFFYLSLFHVKFGVISDPIFKYWSSMTLKVTQIQPCILNLNQKFSSIFKMIIYKYSL
jgi:hypothetical protein